MSLGWPPPVGIKRRAIEGNGGPSAHALAVGDDARFKLDQMRVLIVETFGWGHDELIIQRGTCMQGSVTLPIGDDCRFADCRDMRSVDVRLAWSRAIQS